MKKWTKAELEAIGIKDYIDLAVVDCEPEKCCKAVCLQCDFLHGGPCSGRSKAWWKNNVIEEETEND